MTDQLLSELAKQGLLGILLAIAIAMIFVLAKLLLNEKDKRVEDALTYRSDLVTPIQTLTDFVKAALSGKDREQ